jgi:hypothetical protein
LLLTKLNLGTSLNGLFLTATEVQMASEPGSATVWERHAMLVLPASSWVSVVWMVPQQVGRAGGWCWFVLREKYRWLVCSERKVLLAGG